jgi:hypothetical protein
MKMIKPEILFLILDNISVKGRGIKKAEDHADPKKSFKREAGDERPEEWASLLRFLIFTVPHKNP